MPPTIRLSAPWPDCLSGPDRDRLARDVLGPYLMRQRWFPAKARTLSRLEIDEVVRLDESGAVLLAVTARYADGGEHRYAMPVALVADRTATPAGPPAPGRVIALVEGPHPGALHDDLGAGLGQLLLDGLGERRRWEARRGTVCGEPSAAFARLRGPEPALPARQVTTEQSNSSVIFGDRLILKLIRRLEPGLNPDYEIGRHLTEGGFPGVPALAGAVVWRDAADEPVVVAIAQSFVTGAEPARECIVRGMASFVRAQAARADMRPGDLPMRAAADGACLESRALGRRTGALHLALADDRGDPAFAPQPVDRRELAAIAADMRSKTIAALDLLGEEVPRLAPGESELATSVLSGRHTLLEAVDRVAQVAPGLARIRVHGDYQLDQVLLARGEFAIIDFEGEPLRPLPERRVKFLALKDVAGMVRSYSYAAYAGLFDAAGDDESLVARLDPVARWWQAATGQAFVEGYREAVGVAPFVPAREADFQAILDAFLAEKATYELRYELGHRPAWLRIPLRGLAGLLQGAGGLRSTP